MTHVKLMNGRWESFRQPVAERTDVTTRRQSNATEWTVLRTDQDDFLVQIDFIAGFFQESGTAFEHSDCTFPLYDKLHKLDMDIRPDIHNNLEIDKKLQ